MFVPLYHKYPLGQNMCKIILTFDSLIFCSLFWMIHVTVYITSIMLNILHITSYILCKIPLFLRLSQDTHKKKVVFLVVGPLRFYPPYTKGLVAHAIFFFFSLKMA